MFMRVDKLQAELPQPDRQDANAAAALRELLGGTYGEMSTLNNHLFQSLNFRSKSKLRPFLQPGGCDHFQRTGARETGVRRSEHAG